MKPERGRNIVLVGPTVDIMKMSVGLASILYAQLLELSHISVRFQMRPPNEHMSSQLDLP